MGVLSFLPIQPGEGEPSPENKRPIYAPLNIDGIGEIWGGEINTNTATITSKWHGINLNGVDNKVNNGSYMTDEIIAAGIVYLPRFTSTNGIPDLVSHRLNYILANNMKCAHRAQEDGLPKWTIPGSGKIYVVLWLAPRDEHPEVTTNKECIAFVNNWLKENPVQFVYLLPTEQHVTYHLTTAQLYQALDQLKTYFGGELPLTQIPEIRRRILLNEPHLVTPAPAALHTFSTDMVAPLKECKIHFEPVQASGTPSPDNPLSITGWTGVELCQAGRNLMRLDGNFYRRYPSGGVFSGSSSFSTLIFPIPRADIYYLSPENGACSYMGNCDEPPGANVPYFRATTMTNRSAQMIADNTHRYMYLTLGRTYETNIEGFLDKKLMITVGNYETNYSPPSGIGTTVDWSSIGEIPGGYIDLVRGVLVQTWGMGILTGNQSWTEAKNGLYYTRNDEIERRSDYRGHLIANKMQTSVADNDLTAGFPSITAYRASSSYGGSNWIYVYVDPTVIDTTAKFKEWISTNNIQYAYEMKTPVEHPIDPITLKTLRGLNNIWSNANGNIDLAYWTH